MGNKYKYYKYRLNGSHKTFSKAVKWVDYCRALYNTALEQRIFIYKRQRASMSCFDQFKQLPELRASMPEYQEMDSHMLRQVLKQVEHAYALFFKRIKKGNKRVGFPRFKGKNRYHSLIFEETGWRLDGKYLYIRNLGRFKLRLSRPIEGAIKTVTIRRSQTGKWYVCFSCKNVSRKKISNSNKAIGIDVGIKSFCVDSEGQTVDNPQYLKRSFKKLRRKQRVLFRRKKGSGRRNKARVQVAKAHEKVMNQRNDFLHKVANYYVKNYGVLCIEDLNIKGMVRNHCLARSISDAGWGKFIELLEFKAEEAGRKVIRIPRFEPSSKTCSECGAVNHDLTLNDRQWVCRNCGVLHDRDCNAAKNISRAGQALQEQTYAVTQSVS